MRYVTPSRSLDASLAPLSDDTRWQGSQGVLSLGRFSLALVPPKSGRSYGRRNLGTLIIRTPSEVRNAVMFFKSALSGSRKGLTKVRVIRDGPSRRWAVPFTISSRPSFTSAVSFPSRKS